MTLKSLAACLVLGLGPCAVELLLHTSPSLDIRRPRFRTLPGRPQLENKFEIASDLVPCRAADLATHTASKMERARFQSCQL